MARQAQMLAAVLLSIVISAMASWLFHGRVGADFVITGGVAGLIVNLLIARLTRGLRQRNRRLEREILERDGELRAIRAAAELAHEVRNPLSAVLGNLELALELIADRSPDDGAVRDVVRDLVRDAHTAARHMYALLSDLRRTPDGAARRGEGRARVQDAAFAARAMALAHLRHSVQVEVAGAHDCPPVAVVHAHMVQILHNLVLNAAHASRQDVANVVTIRHAVEGDRVHVVVADLGAGMPPEVVARAFEPGFTTRKGSGGSGFGLAIVRQLVEAAGGRVTVDSRLGAGTEVHLWIPVAADAPPPARSPDSLDPATDAHAAG